MHNLYIWCFCFVSLRAALVSHRARCSINNRQLPCERGRRKGRERERMARQLEYALQWRSTCVFGLLWFGNRHSRRLGQTTRQNACSDFTSKRIGVLLNMTYSRQQRAMQQQQSNILISYLREHCRCVRSSQYFAGHFIIRRFCVCDGFARTFVSCSLASDFRNLYSSRISMRKCIFRIYLCFVSPNVCCRVSAIVCPFNCVRRRCIARWFRRK